MMLEPTLKDVLHAVEVIAGDLKAHRRETAAIAADVKAHRAETAKGFSQLEAEFERLHDGVLRDHDDRVTALEGKAPKPARTTRTPRRR